MIRIKYLNNKKITEGEYVIYYMQQSQRVSYNHALSYAIKYANDLNKKLLVAFFVMDNFNNANYRHYKFMFEGLKEVKEELNKRNIKFLIKHEDPIKGLKNLEDKACLIICDKGYLKNQRKIKDELNKELNKLIIEVESDVLIPVEEVSNKEEYGAYTIRNKITKLIEFYKKDFEVENINIPSNNDRFDEFDLDNIKDLKIDFNIGESSYKGGISEARKLLKEFLEFKIDKYDERNDPTKDYTSHLSPYIHFGQISVLEILLKTNNDSFIEQLIVRRELAINFVYYNDNYDNYNCLNEWSLNTLNNHINDIREYNYTLNELENYMTHDLYWNKAQKCLVKNGTMHNYMRMYWGKKIIEWTKSYKEAYEILVYLNDKYALDGRDANGYAGIAWCFGKHDRPFVERKIFGQVRYMNKEGLERKFDMKKYIEEE